MLMNCNIAIDPGTKHLVERVMNATWHLRKPEYHRLHFELLTQWDGEDISRLNELVSTLTSPSIVPSELEIVRLKTMYRFYQFWKQVNDGGEVVLVKLIDWRVFDTHVYLLFESRPRVIRLGFNPTHRPNRTFKH